MWRNRRGVLLKTYWFSRANDLVQSYKHYKFLSNKIKSQRTLKNLLLVWCGITINSRIHTHTRCNTLISKNHEPFYSTTSNSEINQ